MTVMVPPVILVGTLNAGCYWDALFLQKACKAVHTFVAEMRAKAVITLSTLVSNSRGCAGDQQTPRPRGPGPEPGARPGARARARGPRPGPGRAGPRGKGRGAQGCPGPGGGSGPARGPEPGPSLELAGMREGDDDRKNRRCVTYETRLEPELETWHSYHPCGLHNQNKLVRNTSEESYRR